jgi:hypothetical protein
MSAIDQLEFQHREVEKPSITWATRRKKDLFPKVKKILNKTEIDAIEQAIVAEQEELEAAGEPRAAIPSETGEAAPV